MEKLKIALLQIMPEGSIDNNLKKGIEACRRAKALGADIALFPEMWSNGYDIPCDIEVLTSMAVSMDSDFVDSFRELAAELEMAITVTFLEEYEPLPRNTVCLFDMNGQLITDMQRCTPAISEMKQGFLREMIFMWESFTPKRESSESAQ